MCDKEAKLKETINKTELNDDFRYTIPVVEY